MDTRIFEGVVPDRIKKVDIFIKNSTAKLYNDYLRINEPPQLQFY